MPPVDVIGWSPAGALRLLDQTLLPSEVRHLELNTTDEIIEAIRSLRVRGAPLIGVAAAMGLSAIARRRLTPGAPEPLTLEWLERESQRLADARPTAVNLRWAVDRMLGVAREAFAAEMKGAKVVAKLREEAQAIWDEDARMCRAIGEAGRHHRSLP